MGDDRLDTLRRKIACEYPHLEVLAQVKIAGSECLIVEGSATEALVRDWADLQRYFQPRDVIQRPATTPPPAQTIDAKEANQRWLF